MDYSIIKERNQIDPADTWAIEDLYASDDCWEQEFSLLEKDKDSLAAFAGSLAFSAQKLFDFLELTEKTTVRISKLGNYCMRKADEDTSNSKYQGMAGKFMTMAVTLRAVTSFDTPEIMAIEEDVLEGLEIVKKYNNIFLTIGPSVKLTAVFFLKIPMIFSFYIFFS